MAKSLKNEKVDKTKTCQWQILSAHTQCCAKKTINDSVYYWALSSLIFFAIGICVSIYLIK